MTKEQLKGFYDAMTTAQEQVAALREKRNSFEDDIAFRLADRKYDEAIIRYNAAFSEWMAAEPVQETHGGKA